MDRMEAKTKSGSFLFLMMIPENIILKVVLKILQANLGNQVVHGVDSVLEHGVLDPVGTKLNMQNHWKCNFPMNPLMSGCCLLDGRSIDIGRFVDRFVIKGRGVTLTCSYRRMSLIHLVSVCIC